MSATFPARPWRESLKRLAPKVLVFKNLGAGLQVLFVDGEDQAGIGEVEFVIAAVDEHTAGVKDCAHGSIDEDRAAGEDVGEVRHSVAMLSYRTAPRQLAGPDDRVALLYFGSHRLRSHRFRAVFFFAIRRENRQPVRGFFTLRPSRGHNPRNAPRFSSR